ncbi:MAG TPA: efflux RND transporter permease subunit [Phycisphaerae bacterium]|nr:efflux RND transporter permease subunit [Phycisphaerae bacterium]
MISRFFMERPVFAWVIAIAIMAAGVFAILTLPISQYPPIAPPSIAVEAFYPGASAQTVENSVTQIIEQKMTGFDKLLYLSATSDASGSSRIELTFAPGTDPDLAWAEVQNKLQLAMASLPSAVQRQGVKVSKSTRNYLIIVGLISEDGSMDGNDLRDYAGSNIEKDLARVPGVGEVQSFGSLYAMRVWLDPDKMSGLGVTMEDVTTALRAYNVEISGGQFGTQPAVPGQRLNASILVQSFLKTPEEFAAIPIRINPDGSSIQVRHVGRTELGTEFYDIQAFYNGKPAAAMAIRQAAGANALDTANAVRAKLDEMSKYFPPGMKAIVPYDTTPFVKVAIDEVVKTLIEAIILVFLVMYLFLGNFRATIIPTIAVPIVVLGTFASLGLFGYSINMLTMFAMVLAIGLLVDDAIVVVENVERIMSEEGLSPRQATLKSMNQITSALIGIGLVLSAVFGPMAFFAGSTGVIYRQFSVTIITAMLLSVVVALVLTPVLCAAILKPVPAGHSPSEAGLFLFRPFFRWFDRLYAGAASRYIGIVSGAMKRRLRYTAAFVVIVASLSLLYSRMPTGYLPDEDQGILLVQASLPANSTSEQTSEITNTIAGHFETEEQEAVASCMTIEGMSMSGRGQNQGLAFVKLRDWEERDGKELKVSAVTGRAMHRFAGIRNARVFAFAPPAVPELGNAKGFDFQLLDRGGLGHAALTAARNELLGMAAQDARLRAVRPNGLEDVPQYRVDVDWDRAGALGVPIGSVHNAISAAFGSAYVSDFVQGGRAKRVFVQADAPHRMEPRDLDKLYVRNLSGKMVPLSALATGHWEYGPSRLERYNGFPAMNIQGEPAPGISSGDAMKAMEEIVAKLPAGVGFDWTGLSYQERMSSSQALPLYMVSVFVIFLVLAALYNSWSVPLAVLLILPLGAIGGVISSTLLGKANDVYFQIGLLTTLGLTTKNAILIIQFAMDRIKQGTPPVAAALEASKLRLRPIIMTSLAFGFGVLPMALTSGAGAGAQNAISIGVLGGMVASTVLAPIFAPLFYVMIHTALTRKQDTQASPLSAPNPGEF